jgi:hypothetical protein
MTVVTDAYSTVANIIESVVLTEFADEFNLIVAHDRIHESVGIDGMVRVGISPEEEMESGYESRMTILIQFYGTWVEDVDPLQVVDPRVITNKAERLKTALQNERTVGTPEAWFFDVTNIRFPNDPTGNKSRFEMGVSVRGNNTGLIESIA